MTAPRCRSLPTISGCSASLETSSGRIAQRESARFTRERSLVRSQVRPPSAQPCESAPHSVGVVALGVVPASRPGVPIHGPLEVVVAVVSLGRVICLRCEPAARAPRTSSASIHTLIEVRRCVRVVVSMSKSYTYDGNSFMFLAAASSPCGGAARTARLPRVSDDVRVVGKEHVGAPQAGDVSEVPALPTWRVVGSEEDRPTRRRRPPRAQ
jgi:hypothetical protein